jgi:uncharacterized membrane protein YhaH (DUF805 family)
MTFGEAIQSGFSNYANFNGRAPRSAYWWWWLFTVLVSLVAQFLDRGLGLAPMAMEPNYGLRAGLISGIASLVLLLPSLAVAVRRLHDTDRSGWWLLIAIIPIIGWLVLIFFFASPGTLGPNRYGPPPHDDRVSGRYDLPPVN